MAATPVQPSITANITNAPTLTLTTTKTLTNSPAPVVNVFKNVSASGGGYNGVLDTGNNSIIKQIVIKVTGVINFPNEKLTIDGFDIPLLKTTVDGRFPTGGSLTNGSSYSVVQIGSVTTVTLKNLNLLTLGDTNQANALMESILYKNTDPTPTDGNRSIIMVSMTDGGVVGTSNNGYFGQNYTAFNPSLMTSTVTLDRTAPNAPVLNVAENDGVGVTNIEGQDGTSVVVSLAGTGAREGDVVTLTVKDLAPIKYTLQGLDIDSESVNLAISAATLTLLGSGSVPVNVTITDAAQNTSVVSSVNMNLVNVNSAPSGTSSAITILEDNSRTFTASDFGFSDVVSDFFYGENSGANALSAVIITALPAMGTLTLNNVNVIQNQRIPAANLGDLKYTPALNGNGMSYASVGFKVQDNGGTANGGSDTSTANTLTINVTPVNDAPTLVNQIPNQMAVFNTAFDYTIPFNTFADVDSPALTYLATLDNGSLLPPWLNFDAATGKFTGTAKSTAGFNVKVTASDGALNVSNMFQIDLAPMVTNVAITGATGSQNNRLNAGDVVSASVTFSESVNVTGLPQLILNIGGNTVKADYASGSGTSVLTFNYTILPSQHDTDGISIEANALSLNAGTIKDANGNHAVISIAQAMDNASYIVDNVTPLWLSSNPNDNGYLMDLAANLSLTFNEGVSKGTGTIQLYNAANTLVESFDVATSSRITGWNAKTLTIDPTANLTANTGYYVKIASTAINDLAGNAYVGISDATTLNFTTVDATGSIVPTTSTSTASSNTRLGYTLSNIGDFNGDGYDDLLIGDYAADSYYWNTYGGAAYVVYGNASGIVPNLNSGTIAASLGFRVVGGNWSQLGTSLSGAGDVNGDGYMDILVSTLPGYQYANGAFASYVMYGTSNSAAVFGSRFEMYYGGLPTSMGFKIYGPGWGNDYGPGGLFGENVSQLGDVNGDGLSDFAVTQHTPSGGQTIGTYVMYGKTGGASYYLTAAAISPNDGFLIGTVGTEISGAGDVNGDGLADIIVSSDYYNTAFVVYGNSISSSVSLSYGSGSIAGTQGFKIVGPPSNSVGYALSSAGDVNGDGLADLIVGVAANNGSVFVVYGNSTGSTVDFSSGNIAASQGYKISASSAVTNLGYSVSSAGDMNGDGLNDLILSASGSNSVYVVYGNATGTNMTLGASISPSQGFVIKGPVGTAVSSAGDVNGDGLADLLLGPAGGAIGYSIILGGTQWVTSAVNGVGKVDGTSADEAIIGSASDDTLTGGGGVDRFFAGKGNDTIVLTASDIANLANNTAGQSVKANVNGGNGFDTIELNGGANLDLTTISNTAAMSTDETSRIDNIERIDLSTDKAANTLKLHTKDVNDMAGMNVFHTGIASADGKVWTNVTGNALSATTTAKHQMLVDGDSNDSVSLNASNGVWRNVGAVSNGANNYNVYENSNTASQVLVKSGVAVQNTGAPLLISSNPTDSGYMMGLGNNITLTFDQPIQQGIGTIQLWNGTTGAFVESFDVTSSALVTGWSSTTLTINPTADLAPNNNYFVKVGDAALKNAAGATFTGVNLSTTVDFTTVDAAGSIVVNNSISWISQGLGNDVAGVGDFNGDGYDDVIIGAYKESLYGSSYTQDGAAYVVYGNSTGTVPIINGTIANSQGFKLMGGEMNWLGWAVSGVGDINGDGYSDLMLASGNDLRSGVGSASYVVYGRSAMSDTTGYNQGPRIAGAYHAISGAGDVNGDGIADMVVTQYSPTTAYYAGNGAAYVLYGSTAGGGWDLRFGTLAANQGFKIASGSAASLGYSASSAGDFNGDGFADIIVSARTYGAQNQGAAYVVYGNSTGAGVSFDATNGIAASQGFRISGQVNTNLGESVSSAGDVNGDGLADVMVSSKTAGVGGSVYVLYGTGAGNGLDIDLNTSAGTIAANRGFVISNAQVGGNLGSYMASAGDVNGDGLSDMILSAPSTNNSAYIVYGNANGTSVAINSNGQIAASQGFRLTGSVGLDVSSAGDINGDGLADLVMGGGASYGVILGGTQWLSLVVDGIGAVNGTSESEALIGSTGNDTLTGGGGVDRFFAGMGNDTIVLTASDFTNLANNVTGQTAKENVNGGNGFDTIRVSGGANVDLMSISNAGAMGLEENSRIESIERIDLATDSAANKLTLAAKDVKDMASFNMIRTGSASADGNTWINVTGSALSATTRYHQVVVDGTSADSMTLVEDLGLWSNSGTVSNGTATYTVYQNAATASQVLVKSDVLVASAVAPNPIPNPNPSPSPSPVAPVVNMGAPVLLSGNPSDNGYMMAVGNNISMTFDQAVSKGTGTIQLWNGATNALVESFDVATSSLVTGWASKTLTINPSANLAFSSSYYIKTTDSAIKNTAGKTFAGISDATTYNFTTAASDGSISAGVTYTGLVGSYVGISVSSAGDVNADGFDDYIIGTYANKAYVVYGNASGTGASVPNGNIASSLGFQIIGTGALGYKVSGAGDVNGDGFADVIVGTNASIGAAYVVYGGSNITKSVNVTATSFSPANGFKITGVDSYMGMDVSSAGDINGDGLADLIVGAQGYNAATETEGAAFIVYGTTNNTGVDLSNGTIPVTNGFRVTGQDYVYFASSISSAGDVNGDGLADLVIGGFDTNIYVVYGKAKTIDINLSSTIIAATNGFRIVTNQLDTTIGNTVSSAGDVNGDGLGDLVMSGENAYVVYGNSTGRTVTIDVNGVIAASNGFRIAGLSNYAVSSAGDVNGDGLADVLVGKNSTNGAAYVVYGNASGTTVTVDANGNIPTSSGFKITGETSGSMGKVLSAAGDINGDGLGDLLIGSLNENGAYNVVLGGTQWLTSAVSLTGTAGNEAVMGTVGNDTLIGGGGIDRFFAGMGNDTLVLTASDVTNLANNVIGAQKANVSGGNGFDTIRLSGGAVLDLTTISNVGAMGLEENSRIESIERIDMTTDTAANKLTLAAKDVKDMVGFNMIRTGGASADGNTWTNVTGSALSATTKYHQLVVDGTSADGVTLAADLGFWANAGTASNGAATYTIYQNTGTNSQVLVSSDVVVTNNDATPNVVLTGLVI